MLFARPLLLLAIIAALAGCAAQDTTPLTQAIPREEPSIQIQITPSKPPQFTQTARSIGKGSSAEDSSRLLTDAVLKGLPAIVKARRDAVITSAPEGFINATQYFQYEQGALYELHVALGYLSTIQLQPGEELINYAAGDTSRWIIGNVARGDQQLLLVKATRPDLSTNIVVSTNKRIYLIEATSRKGNAYNATIAWTYPQEEISQQVAAVDRENERRADTIVTGVPIEQLDFGYKISGDKPSWRPIRAFSDGVKTYVEFPKGSNEAPPLFLRDASGSGQLVNYRIKRNYYIVDRLFDEAELKLDGTTVRISRKGARS